MGTSSGLIHHYFESMDDVLAAAFERVAAQDLGCRRGLMAEAASPVEALGSFFRTYTPADKDWAFQLWLDAWAEAARRPAVRATSRRLEPRVAGRFSSDDPRPGSPPARSAAPDPARRRMADPVAA